VRHNGLLTRGQPWGSFLDVRANAAAVYRERYERERTWARRNRSGFSIFLSSSTDPYVPQEARYGVTRDVLTAMLELPPDELILQTHSDRIVDHLALHAELAERCRLRIHLSIESDRDRLPGLPAPACSVERRFAAAAALKRAGLQVVITVAPLLPIKRPGPFFERIAGVADAVVLDHFIGGDGSADGARTMRTALPAAMAEVDPASTSIEYREQMIEIASHAMPGRVGVSIDGFAGRFT